VVGVDLSAAMLEQARARNNPHLQLVLGDFSQLPFAASSFDRVLMAFAARHARDLTGVLNAAATVLSSDGQLLMVDYSGGTQLALSGAVMRCYALLEEIGGVVDSDVASSAFFAPCGEQELLLHATQAGFTIGPVRHVTIVEAEGPAAVAAFVMNSPPIAFDLVRCSVEQRRQVFTSLVSAGHRILPKRIASDIVVCASRPPRKR
jgi:SAM-dependent methyltransferase